MKQTVSNTEMKTSRQVATMCGVTLKAVHNWANAALLPCFRTPGRHLRFREADVRKFMATRCQGFVIPDAHERVIRAARRHVKTSNERGRQTSFHALRNAVAKLDG